MREVLGCQFPNEEDSSTSMYKEIVYKPTATEHRKTGLVVSLRLRDGTKVEAKRTIFVYSEVKKGELVPGKVHQANTQLQGTGYHFKISDARLHLKCKKQGALAASKAELRDLVDSMLRTFYRYEAIIAMDSKAATRVRQFDVEQWVYQVAQRLKLAEISFFCNAYRVKLKSPIPLLAHDTVVFRQSLCLRYSPSTHQFTISILCYEAIPLTQQLLAACKHAEIWNHRLAVSRTCSVQSFAELLEATQVLQAEYWWVVMDLAEKGLVKCRYIPTFDKLILQEIRVKGSVNERETQVLAAFRAFNVATESQYSEMVGYAHMLISAAEARVASICDNFQRLKSALQYQALPVSLLSQRVSATSFVTSQSDLARFVDFYRETRLSFSDLMDYILTLIRAVSSIKSSGCAVTNLVKSCYVCLRSHQLVLQPVWLGTAFSIVPGEMGSAEDFVFAVLRKHSVFINEFVSVKEICTSRHIMEVPGSVEIQRKKILFTVDNERPENLPLIPTIEALYWASKAAEFAIALPQPSSPVAICKEQTIAFTRYITLKFDHSSSMSLLTENHAIRQSCEPLQAFRTLAALLERAHSLGFPHFHLSPSLFIVNENSAITVNGFRGRLRKMVKTDMQEIEYWDPNIVKYLWWRKQDFLSSEVQCKVRKYEQRIDHTVDIFGFAMLIYGSLVGSPYHYIQFRPTLEDFYVKVIKPGCQPMFLPEFEKKHPQICYFLRRSWGRPAVRPSFADLLDALAKCYDTSSPPQ